MNPGLIPLPDPAGLPGPPWLFTGLLLFTFFLHLLFMNLTLGGTLLAAVAHGLGRGRSEDARTVLARRLMEVNKYAISMTITTGVAPLLFTQVLYHQYFYPATILIAPVWFAMLVLLTAAYYAVYLYKFRGVPARGRGGGVWLTLSAVMFLVIAAIQVGVHLISVQPEKWGAIAGNGWAVVADPTFWPRFLHYVLAGIGMAALVAAWWAVRRAKTLESAGEGAGENAGLEAAIARHAWKWALWTTGLQIADGFVLLGLLPKPVLRGFMSGGPAVHVPLGLGIILGIGLLVMLARITDPVKKGGLIGGSLGTMILTIVFMTITRDQVRALYLEPSTSQFTANVVPQWGNFVLFAVLLVAGLATVAIMVRRVLTSPASGDDAA